MNNLAQALKNVLSRVAALSDEQLQAEFDACRGGAVSRAVLEGRRFLEDCFDEDLESEVVHYVKPAHSHDSSWYSFDYNLRATPVSSEPEAANDDFYLMAA